DLDPARPEQSARYDPAAVIARHGADALRHWAAGSQLGHDVRYHERDVRAGRKVVLKLWNLARFCEAVLIGAPAVAGEWRAPADRWLLHRAGLAVERATAGFEAYNYVAAREAADTLLWAFADDWLEMAKHLFWSPDGYPEAARQSARATMAGALRTLLGLMAPFLPFVTEEIYQRLYAAAEGAVSLHVTPWPTVTE